MPLFISLSSQVHARLVGLASRPNRALSANSPLRAIFSLVQWGMSEVIGPVAANRAEETVELGCGKVERGAAEDRSVNGA
jgi:hypothetical protein